MPSIHAVMISLVLFLLGCDGKPIEHAVHESLERVLNEKRASKETVPGHGRARLEFKAVFDVGPGSVWDADFSQAGDTLSIASEKSVTVWRVEPPTRISYNSDFVGAATGVENVDSESLVAIGKDGVLRRISVTSGKELLRKQVVFKNWGLDVALSPSRDLIATCGSDGVVKILELETFEFVQEISRQKSYVGTLLWSDRNIVIGGWESALRVYDDNALRVFDAAQGKVSALAYGMKGDVLLSGGQEDPTIVAWDTATWEVRSRVNNGSWVHGIVAHPSLPLVCSGDMHGRVRVWDWTSHGTLEYERCFGCSISCLQLSEDGRLLAIGLLDGRCELYEISW